MPFREAIAGGLLGDLLYIDSVRINLRVGLQPDVDVFWIWLRMTSPFWTSFFLVASPLHRCPPPGPILSALERHVWVTWRFRLTSGGIAHVNVNWLSPPGFGGW